MDKNIYDKYKKGAEIHKSIRKWIITWIKPKMKLYDIAVKIEDKIKKMTNFDHNNPDNRGIGFPTGLSINNCAAHFTPQPNDKTILKYDDVIKIDYGVHFDGYIIDSAFTHTFNSKYDQLLECGREATDTGIKLSGNDSILGEIGADIEEVINSYEIELNGKIYKLRSVKNLCGHLINRYEIHGKKSVPNIKINYPLRMKTGEIYAIETFPSTGTGIIKENPNCSHYMINYFEDYNMLLKKSKLNGKDKHFFYKLKKNFNTLAFCKRWLTTPQLANNTSYSNNIMSLFKLVNNKIINKYPPLYDIKGSYISQFEHTIYIKDNGVQIFTK